MKQRIPDHYLRPFLELLLLVISAIFIFVIQYFFKNPRLDLRTKAAGEGRTLRVCQSGCTYVGTTGIQQAVDAASNGDTIIIESGTYSGPNATPLGLGSNIGVSDARGGANTCMVRIEGKTLTIKGQGATLYGEGHARAYQDPYQTRAGLCIVNNAHVTIDAVRVKEFQKRGAVVYNSTVIVKNSTIDGSDEGGYSLLGNSAGLFLNNYFVAMNFGGIMLWQNSQATIINNVFYNTQVLFFYHPNSNDKAHAQIINNIFQNATAVSQVSWWTSELSKLKNNKLSYNLIWREGKPCDANEYCDDFPGKIEQDPLFEGAAIDPTGWVYGSLDLQQASPARNTGDTTIPGPSNLGVAGGPCADPQSTICTQFIAANTPMANPPTSREDTPAPTSQINPPVVPTLSPNDARLNIKVKFQGTTNASSTTTISAKITLQGQGSGVTKTVNFSPNTNGIWSASTIFPNITPASNYQIFIKGARHLQRKICDSTPTEMNPGNYKCGQSPTISLKYGENDLDFSGIYLFAGDINQDGVVDSSDTSSVRANLGKTDSQSLAACDVNFDNVCDSQDFSLVIAALRIRFDDEK